MRPRRRLNEEETIDEEDNNAMDPLLWVIDESHSGLLSVSSVNYVPRELSLCLHRLRNARKYQKTFLEGSAIL